MGARPPDDPGLLADDDRSGGESAATLFALLWETLSDILGTAAAATLLRRAARRAVIRQPALEGLKIARDGPQYLYDLPEAWRRAEAPLPRLMLRELVSDLLPLLAELTGPVVTRRLARLAPLRRAGIIPPDEVEHG